MSTIEWVSSTYIKTIITRYKGSEAIIKFIIKSISSNSTKIKSIIRYKEIKVGENETLESALRRFKRKCARAGVLSEVRKREHYEKPSVKRKKKSEAARKRKFK